MKHSDGGKVKSWQCTAPGCTHQQKGNLQKARILKHAITCVALQENDRELYEEVVAQAIGDSLGAQLKEKAASPFEESKMSETLSAHVTHKGQLRLGPLREAGDTQRENRRQHLMKEVDHIIMRLICVCGLVPNIIDSNEWKELMGKLNGLYKPSTADDFRDKIIPLEAAFVRKEQINLLKQESNLTLTFDGTTIRKPESFYTAHATTPSRKSYFLDGHEGTGEHHNMEWIKGKLMKVSCGFCLRMRTY